MTRILVLLLFFECLLFASTSDSRKRGSDRQRPWEASCPRGCQCTSRALDCRRARITREDLNTVRPEAFPELDTIDFYGADLGAIQDGLFPEGISHPLVTEVNMTKCRITRISPRTFASIPNTEFLDLTDNVIEYAGKETFSQMTKLKKVILKNALARRESQVEMLVQMFDSRGNGRNNLVDLAIINLEDNDLKNVHTSTFCKVSGLVRLQLAGNQLSTFDVDPRCAISLKNLDLSNNNFTTLPRSLWDHVSTVTALDVSRNPIICDCALQPFLNVLQDEGDDFVNQGLTTCAGPPAMTGKNLFDIKQDLCKEGGYGLGTFLLLILVAAGVLFAYRHYRNRRRNKVPFEFAYSGLDADDEVQPEFV